MNEGCFSAFDAVAPSVEPWVEAIPPATLFEMLNGLAPDTRTWDEGEVDACPVRAIRAARALIGFSLEKQAVIYGLLAEMLV